MKVEFNNEEINTTFGELGIGNTFMLPCNDIILSKKVYIKTDGRGKAVCLQTGVCHIDNDDDMPVIKVNAKVVVE